MSATKAIIRNSVTYDPLYAKYILNTKNYVQQYNHMYVARLNQMRTMLRQDFLFSSFKIHNIIAYLHLSKLYSNVATCKWGTAYPILQKIIDIEATTTIDTNNDHGEYILIGTIYKEMSLRGSVLDEFKENNGITGEFVWYGMNDWWTLISIGCELFYI